MKIGYLDIALLAGYLLGMVAFGMWKGRGQKDAADFMVGGRSNPWWLVLFSIVATETSTVTFLSIPGFAFTNDLTWLQLPLGFVLGRLVVVAILLPRYFRGELFTAYQVLDERFGGVTKQAASLLFVITRTLADGLRLFLTAIVLEVVAGIPLADAVVVIGLVTIVYTFFGGIRAVVWTDLVQFVVYTVGAAVAFTVLLGRLDGGWNGLLEFGSAFPTLDGGTVDKFRIFNFEAGFGSAYTLWAGVIGGAVLTVASHGVDQMMVQRYLTARSQRHAAVALGLSGVVVWVQFAFFLVIGVGLAMFYATDQPERIFARADRVFASFIVEELPTGVLGIVLGAVFAAAMSTLSSSLNSSATALANDVWHPLFRPAADSRERLRTVRVLTVVFGLLQIAVGVGGRHLDESVVNAVLSIAGFTTGLILGVFLLGIATRRVGQIAALIGLVHGAVVVSAIAFVPFQLWFPTWTGIAWPWYALIGSVTTFGFGLAASSLFPRRRADFADD